jgi:UDP-N-acetylmuramoyl-L-alanyl-D-glutamate--2,6-diaminopimelate ligase
MAQLARRLYRQPDRDLIVIGVTGTNGKTTTTFLLGQLLDPLGKTGRIGTLTYFNGLAEEAAGRTTPEATDFYRCLREMATNGCKYAAVEISSHGLMYDRVLGLELRYAIFTNLSRDHLDFHGDMESYFLAKHKQFDHLVEGGVGIVNWDDAYGRRIQVPARAKLLSYGTSPDADLRFEVLHQDISGCEFNLHWQGRTALFKIPLLGQHNIYNYSAALAVALCEGRELEELSRVAHRSKAVPGRTEFLNLGQDFGVVVDFAHTPDALANVLEACGEGKPKRLIVVFGAGGDRDQSKRPEMGAAVDARADIIFLTSDNPRSENPESIMEMIRKGIRRPVGEGLYCIPDRRAAIEQAIDIAQTGDLLVIAGKGHETTQEIEGRLRPFDDRTVASHSIRARLERSSHV